MATSFPMLIVNNEPVDPSLIEDAFQRIKTTAEMLTEVSCCERDGEFYAEAEQEVIDGILLAKGFDETFNMRWLLGDGEYENLNDLFRDASDTLKLVSSMKTLD